MKKLLLVLGMLTCLFGLSACSSKEASEENYGVTKEVAIEYAGGLIQSLNEIILTGQEAQYKSEEVIMAALDSFKAALTEMGEYQSVIETDVIYEDGIIITSLIQGSLRQANVEIILDAEELLPTSVTTNVVYSFGEMMTKAALNTLMGMGTVFTVLIIIIILISSFSLINKVQKKEEMPRKEIRPEPAPLPVAEEIEEAEEDLCDDLELVAVIAAAIAAYEGKESAESYIVRSLRKR